MNKMDLILQSRAALESMAVHGRIPASIELRHTTRKPQHSGSQKPQILAGKNKIWKYANHCRLWSTLIARTGFTMFFTS